MAQVARWQDKKIGEAFCGGIAAWFQSPGTDGIDFTQFASAGRITGDLVEAIKREIDRLTRAIVSTERNAFGAVDGCDAERDDQRSALEALLAYVQACREIT